eukprot:6394665-Amphidinium_carterae.2
MCMFPQVANPHGQPTTYWTPTTRGEGIGKPTSLCFPTWYATSSSLHFGMDRNMTAGTYSYVSKI